MEILFMCMLKVFCCTSDPSAKDTSVYETVLTLTF